jgi:hypothetical protein
MLYFQYVEAIIRRKDEVGAAVRAVVFSIGNVQLYQRNRNKLNLIIIPVSIGFVVFLFVLTYFLRRMRFVKSFIFSSIAYFFNLEMPKNVFILYQNYTKRKKLI